MNKDFVSIIMPVKNVENFINQCIDSILEQTFSNYELIILDDSKDNTSKIIKNYSDKRIKHVILSGNISKKLNYGIKIAKYNYICRMDGDDIMAPDRIEKQIRYLKNHPRIDILGTNYYCIDEKGTILYKKKLPETHKDIEFMMPIITSVLHPTVITSKRVFDKIGGYNENINCSEDTEIFLRCIKRFEFYNLQESLYYYRILESSNSKNINSLQYSYKFGKNYLTFSLVNNKSYLTDKFRLGLLEYYKNDINKSRKIFFSLLFNNSFPKIKLLRYLLPSILGNRILKFFRKNKILIYMNKSVLNLFKFDTNNISRI